MINRSLTWYKSRKPPLTPALAHFGNSLPSAILLHGCFGPQGCADHSRLGVQSLFAWDESSCRCFPWTPMDSAIADVLQTAELPRRGELGRESISCCTFPSSPRNTDFCNKGPGTKILGVAWEAGQGRAAEKVCSVCGVTQERGGTNRWWLGR